MLPMDELERLSRFLEGELSEEEEKALKRDLQQQPALARALEAMKRLQNSASALGNADAKHERAGADDEALIAVAVERARHPAEPSAPLRHLAETTALPQRPAWRRATVAAVAAAAGIAAAVGLFSTLRSKATSVSVAPPAPVAALSPSADPSADRIEYPPAPADGPMPMLKTKDGALLAGPGARVARGGDESLELVSGTAVARGTALILHAPGQVLEIRGQAVVTTEPSSALAHVSRLFHQHPERDEMTTKLEGFRTTLQTVGAATLVLMTLDGEVLAQAKEGNTTPTVVRKDHVWTPQGGARPAPHGSGQVTKAALEGTPQKGGAASAPSPTKEDTETWPGRDAAPPTRNKTSTLIEGRIDAVKLHAAILARGSEMGACFSAGQTTSPELTGELTLHLTLRREGTHGKLVDASVGEDYSLNQPFVASCVLQALARGRWPAPEGQQVRLTYPLGFERRGSGPSPGAALILPLDAITAEGHRIGSIQIDRAAKQNVRTEDAPSLGPADAPVTMVMFSDFRCSFCQKAWPAVKQLSAIYGSKLRIVFRHKPLPQPAGAREGCAAALAAHEQGRFWEYADRLMQHPGAHDEKSLEAHAGALGLDVLRFRGARGDARVEQRIEADLAEAERLGVQGIPTFFINGREVVGARPVDAYRAIIDAELKRVRR